MTAHLKASMLVGAHQRHHHQQRRRPRRASSNHDALELQLVMPSKAQSNHVVQKKLAEPTSMPTSLSTNRSSVVLQAPQHKQLAPNTTQSKRTPPQSALVNSSDPNSRSANRTRPVSAPSAALKRKLGRTATDGHKHRHPARHRFALVSAGVLALVGLVAAAIISRRGGGGATDDEEQEGASFSTAADEPVIDSMTGRRKRRRGAGKKGRAS